MWLRAMAVRFRLHLASARARDTTTFTRTTTCMTDITAPYRFPKPPATRPNRNGMGNANNTISFNHVYNLLQGIMNDGGAIRIESGNQVFAAAGNKMLNNKIHDVSDASALDANGYGGHGIYLDNQTGLVDVENNLVYRVSGNAVHTPQGPAVPNEANIVKNNILAFARLSMVDDNSPYQNGVPSVPALAYVITKIGRAHV